MDVYDAGVYAYTFAASVPRGMKVVLWGPLQAKEMGLGDWSYQDGGETGFIYHSPGRAVKMGRATATLIVVRRLERATLTVYLAGYPSDAAHEQRLIDVRGLVNEAELFLTRLAAQPVRFELEEERPLVDHTSAPRQTESATRRAPAPSRAKGLAWDAS